MEQEVNWLYVAIDLAFTCVMLVVLLGFGHLGSQMFQRRWTAIRWMRESDKDLDRKKIAESVRGLLDRRIGLAIKLLRGEAILGSCVLVALSVGGARLAVVGLVWLFAMFLHLVIVYEFRRELSVGTAAQEMQATIEDFDSVVAAIKASIKFDPDSLAPNESDPDEFGPDQSN